MVHNFVVAAAAARPCSRRSSLLYRSLLYRSLRYFHSASEGTFSNAISPTAYVDRRCKLGARCKIGPFVHISEGVTVGDDCDIAAHSSLTNCDLGDRVIVGPGVRIGQDGFGFQPDERGHAKKPQELRVVIGDDVEIGANTTIDRGSWRNTEIKSGCKLDNLIQIGHNVILGKGCLIAAQTGVAGSTTVGDFVMIGGQVGIAQHLTVGNRVKIAAKSGVINDLKENLTYGGYPAVEIKDFHRQTLMLRKMTPAK